MADAATILLRAAARIEETGLFKGDMAPLMCDTEEYDSVPVCLEGAVCWAETGNPWQGGPLHHDAIGFVRKLIGDDSHFGASHWNDADERTAKEVVDVLRRAADLADQT